MLARLSGANWKAHWPTLIVSLMAVGFTITFTALGLERFWAFETGFDLGVYNQVAWNTLQGRFLFYTVAGQPMSHLSNHASPIMALVAPFYLLHNGPATLLAVQAAAVASGAWPVLWLTWRKLGNAWLGVAMAGAYLLYPPAQAILLSEFHPPVLAIGFFLWAIYCLETERWPAYWLFVVLALASKEQIPLQVIFLGLYILLGHRKLWPGLSTILLGAGWFVVVMYWVIPAHSVVGEHIFLGYYADFGAEPLEIVLTVLTRPDLVLENLLQPEKIRYLRDVFAPYAFLPLLGLPVLLIGSPSFAINLLSNNPAMYDPTRGHYVADVVPWTTLAAIYGLYFISLGLRKLAGGSLRAAHPPLAPDEETASRPLRERGWGEGESSQANTFKLSDNFLPALGAGLVFGVALGWQIAFGHSPLAVAQKPLAVTAQDEIGHRLLAEIPPSAPVAAQLSALAHLSHRPVAYVFPQQLDKVDYIFLDVTADTSPLHPNNHRAAIAELLAEAEFGLWRAEDGFLIFRRGWQTAESPNLQTLPAEFYRFAQVDEAQPQYPLNLQFGDSVRLLGYDVLDDPRRAETWVRFYWQAVNPVKADLQLWPFFVNAEGQLIEDTTLRPMTTQLWYPPILWPPGQIIVSQTRPWPLGEQWSLGVGVLHGSDWADWSQRLKVSFAETNAASKLPPRRFETNTWARVGTFAREGRALIRLTPIDADLTPPQALNANFGDQMALQGYGISQDNDTLTVTLYWQALAAMGYDYTVFVHLLDENGAQVAQHDGQPTWDVPLPTSTWQAGERLRARHPIALPAELPPGAYQLRVGVYYWQTLERLPVLENGLSASDTVLLGPISVE